MVIFTICMFACLIIAAVLAYLHTKNTLPFRTRLILDLTMIAIVVFLGVLPPYETKTANIMFATGLASIISVPLRMLWRIIDWLVSNLLLLIRTKLAKKEPYVWKNYAYFLEEDSLVNASDFGLLLLQYLFFCLFLFARIGLLRISV